MSIGAVPAAGRIVAQSESGLIDQLQAALDSSQITWQQVVGAIVVLVVAYPVGRLASRLIRRSVARLPDADIPSIIVDDVARLTKVFIWLVAAGVALAILGADIGWLSIAAIFTIGIAVLALRPWIMNTAAGLVLTVRPAFGIGDQIEVDGNRGEVLEITSHSTVIETVDGIRIHVTNNKMIQETVKVYTARDARRTEFTLNLDGSTDIGHAITTFTSALAGADIIVQDPAPIVVASGFGGDGVTVTARVWYPTSMTSDSAALDASVQAVTAAMQEAGIRLNKNDVTLEQISPTFDVTVHGDDAPPSNGSGDDGT
jgi:small-conductance mechanosensitive channel